MINLNWDKKNRENFIPAINDFHLLKIISEIGFKNRVQTVKSILEMPDVAAIEVAKTFRKDIRSA